MTKVYVLYDDPYYGVAQIYGVFRYKQDAENKAYLLSTDPEIWGPHVHQDWQWNYEVVERDLE